MTDNLQWLAGIQVVSTALQHDPEHVHALVLAKGKHNARLQRLLQQARRLGIPLQQEDEAVLTRRAGSPHHQGVLAAYRPPEYLDEAAMLERLAGRRGLVLALDGVTDPGNLGACLRSADGAGVDLVLLPRDRAASVTPTVRKRSAGAADRLPIARVTNLARALDGLRHAGYWVVGADGEGESLYAQPLALPLVLVMGAEDRGLRPNVRKRCDWLLSLPMLGAVESLNVSVATGVFLYEIRRQQQISGTN